MRCLQQLQPNLHYSTVHTYIQVPCPGLNNGPRDKRFGKTPVGFDQLHLICKQEPNTLHLVLVHQLSVHLLEKRVLLHYEPLYISSYLHSSSLNHLDVKVTSRSSDITTPLPKCHCEGLRFMCGSPHTLQQLTLMQPSKTYTRAEL